MKIQSGRHFTAILAGQQGAVVGSKMAAIAAACVFRRSPPVIPIERHHQFQWKASSVRSEATLELKSFPKWMASVK
jgi:hypothetical protein